MALLKNLTFHLFLSPKRQHFRGHWNLLYQQITPTPLKRKSDVVLMLKYELYKADCIEKMRELPEASIDAVITDSPYFLEFMGEEFDSQWDSMQDFQSWNKKWATEALRVLKTGGFMFAMGGTRTHHRLTCGIEDAGFLIRDELCWVYTQGFPKAQDLSMLIEKKLGEEGEVVGENPNTIGRTTSGQIQFRSSNNSEIKQPTLLLAKEWQGWKTPALKPAWENLILCQKPYEFDKTNLFKYVLTEYRICQLSLASTVANNSPSSLAEQTQNTALILAKQNIKAHDLQFYKEWQIQIGREEKPSDQTATYITTSLENLTTFLLWKNILGVLYCRMSKSITGTELGMITELKTLNSLLYQNTQENTTKENNPKNGRDVNALIVERILKGINARLLTTQKHFAIESVIGNLEGKNWFALSVEEHLALSDILLKFESSVQKNVIGSPEFRPIILAQKPCEGSITENVMKYGVGGYNIDECRIPYENEEDRKNSICGYDNDDLLGGTMGKNVKGGLGLENANINPPNEKGRYPSNILMTEPCFDGKEGIIKANEEPAIEHTPKFSKNNYGLSNFCEGGWKGKENTERFFNESGGFSKFFLIPKASISEKFENTGMKPRKNTRPIGECFNDEENAIEPKTFHPTVKPILLMEHLIKLTTTNKAVILDCFMGSGTTGVACANLNRKFIGIEKDENYFKIAQKRISEAYKQEKLDVFMGCD